MAFNPTPEVAVARDAAAKLGQLHGTGVTHCVVTFATADGRLGYVSYGVNKALCADARKLADAMQDVAERHFSET